NGPLRAFLEKQETVCCTSGGPRPRDHHARGAPPCGRPGRDAAEGRLGSGSAAEAGPGERVRPNLALGLHEQRRRHVMLTICRPSVNTPQECWKGVRINRVHFGSTAGVRFLLKW